MFAVMKVLAGLGKDIGNVSTGAAPFLHTGLYTVCTV